MSQSSSLPPEIQMREQDRAPVCIKAHLLRAKLEMSEEEEPLSLLQLMTLLMELAEHTAAMEEGLATVRATWRQFSRSNNFPAGLDLLAEMRATMIPATAAGNSRPRLRAVLDRQRQTARLCLLVEGALKTASVRFASELAAEFEPGAIIAAVRSDKPQAKIDDYWRHFEARAERMGPNEIEQRLKRILVEAIEDLYQKSAPSES